MKVETSSNSGMCQDGPHLTLTHCPLVTHLSFSQLLLSQGRRRVTAAGRGSVLKGLGGCACMHACTGHWKRVGGGGMKELAFFLCVHAFLGGGLLVIFVAENGV